MACRVPPVFNKFERYYLLSHFLYTHYARSLQAPEACCAQPELRPAWRSYASAAAESSSSSKGPADADAGPSDAQAAAQPGASGTEAQVAEGGQTHQPDEAASSGRTETGGGGHDLLSADELADLLAEKEAALEEQQLLVCSPSSRRVLLPLEQGLSQGSCR